MALSLCSKCQEGNESGNNNLCLRCFNIMNDQFILNIIKDCTEKIQSKYIGVKSISFALSLPICFKIQEILLKSLSITFPSSTKDSFKKELTVKWNLQHNSFLILPSLEADLCATITITYPADFEANYFDFFTNELLELSQDESRRRKDKRKKICSNSALDELLSQPFVIPKLAEKRVKIEKFLTQLPSINPLFQLDCKSKSIFIAGLYNKWERGISQTPWIIGGALKTPLSVSSLIEETLNEIFSFSQTKFCSAGREDADVRMLGKGRPFLLELIDVRNLENVHKYSSNPTNLQTTFDLGAKNSRLVSATSLSIVPGTLGLARLKEGEEEKEKVYRCLIWTKQPISQELINNQLDKSLPFTINQITPIRVLQRRALLERKKQIYELKSQLINSHYFILHLRSEAGTYIKEFVHGDFGRTQPSLASLLWPSNEEEAECSFECDILELDVLSVDLPNWPPLQ